MKVALLSRAVFPLHGHGGLERHVGSLKRHLERAGCELRVFTSPPRKVLSEPRDESYVFVPYRTLPWPRQRGFVVADRNTNYLMWSLRAARELLGTFEPDIVQADAGAGFGYAWLSKEDSPPLVLHPHGMEEFKTTPVKRAAYLPLRSATRYAARHAARVIAPDASMVDEVQEHLGVESERIVVVPNAIDLEEIDRQREPVSLGELGIDDTQTVLLSVGRLEDNKGFVDLVNALADVVDEMPPKWRWVLVGDGPARSRIDNAVHARGIGNHTLLAGSVSEAALHALYERADLFVHPTLYEGSSMVTLEAMAHRTPVIATRVGGIPDKVVDGISGLLVTPGDVEALGRSIAAALSERDMLSEWGVEGRRIAEEAFSWTKRTAEILALYESLV
jgi:glycosyltransferase involved in cell wall biosynthesis